MGRFVNAIRRKLRRGRKTQSQNQHLTRCSECASLKSNANELREQLNQVFSRQDELLELTELMTQQLQGIVTDAKESFKPLNNTALIIDLIKEVKKDSSPGEVESEGNYSSEGSDYSSDGTLSEDSSSSESDDSEEELSSTDDSDEELSEEEAKSANLSEDDLSQSRGDLPRDDDTSCREVEEDSYVEGECTEEDSFRIFTNQSSSEESCDQVQKEDPAAIALREKLWIEETKAYYDRMLREKPELFFPVCYSAPQYYTPWQASSTFVHHQVPSQHYTTGTNMPACYQRNCFEQQCAPNDPTSMFRAGHQSSVQHEIMDQSYLGLQEYTGGEGAFAYAVVGNTCIQNIPQNTVVTKEEEHQLSYSNSAVDFYENPYRVEKRHPVEGGDEPQQSMEQKDRCVQEETLYPEYNMWSVQRIA